MRHVLVLKFSCPSQMPFHFSDSSTDSVAKVVIMNALQNDLLLHSVLSLSAMHKNAHDLGGDKAWQTLYHRGNALRLLVRRLGTLDDSPSDATILGVVLLAVYEASKHRCKKMPESCPLETILISE